MIETYSQRVSLFSAIAISCNRSEGPRYSPSHYDIINFQGASSLGNASDPWSYPNIERSYISHKERWDNKTYELIDWCIPLIEQGRA